MLAPQALSSLSHLPNPQTQTLNASGSLGEYRVFVFMNREYFNAFILAYVFNYCLRIVAGMRNDEQDINVQLSKVHSKFCPYCSEKARH